MGDQVQNGSTKLAVIKIGSSSLTDDEGKPDRAYLADLAHQVARVRRNGWKVIIVSSGAIPCGLEALGLPLQRPKDMPTVQAAASVGQRALSAAYDHVFSPYGIVTSLVLLTRRDTADREAYLHARDTFRRLVELDVVPIVNENDTVSVEQTKFGDNDTLAALVAVLANADRVVILSDIDGLYTANPQTNPDAQLICRVESVTPQILAGASGAGSAVGSGGMVTKLTAATVLHEAGIPMVICNSRAEDAVVHTLEDEPSIGTLFAASGHRHEVNARKLWIALGDSAKGSLVIDSGAVDAIVSSGKSLLSVGVVNVCGDFLADDVINVVDERGFTVARGLARASASDICAKACDIAVHRDELIVFQ